MTMIGDNLRRDIVEANKALTALLWRLDNQAISIQVSVFSSMSILVDDARVIAKITGEELTTEKTDNEKYPYTRKTIINKVKVYSLHTAEEVETCE